MESGKFEYGVEVLLENPDDFLKIKETLTRIGIKSKKIKTLYQSVHILHKRGRYFLLSFKEFFLLDKKEADFSDDDFRRMNTIAKLIAQWGMCEIVFPDDIQLTLPISDIAIIPHKEKKDYILVSKYAVGGRK